MVLKLYWTMHQHKTTNRLVLRVRGEGHCKSIQSSSQGLPLFCDGNNLILMGILCSRMTVQLVWWAWPSVTRSQPSWTLPSIERNQLRDYLLEEWCVNPWCSRKPKLPGLMTLWEHLSSLNDKTWLQHAAHFSWSSSYKSAVALHHPVFTAHLLQLFLVAMVQLQ